MPPAFGIPVALPRRRNDIAADDVPTWPHPRGGQNGTIALPSRIAALEGGAPFDTPSPMPPSEGGQWGPIIRGIFRGGFHAALAGGARPYTPPAPLDRTKYVRAMFPNLYPMVNFRAPLDGPADWTINSHEESTHTPRSSVPFDLRRIGAMSFRKLFSQRVHADYQPRERWQVGSPVTGGQGKGAIMVEPYFPRLTRRPEQTSFGQTTVMLQEPGPLTGPPTRQQLYPGGE